MKTYDINETADFLKVDRSTALELAGTGEIPGAKVGRSWVFLENDLVEYLRDTVRRQTDLRREQSNSTQRKNTRIEAPDNPAKRGRRQPIPSLPTVQPLPSTSNA
jgi:excisionase family DNA binding protein